MKTFIPEQRWTSDPEPELGLAIVIQADKRMVQLLFPASGEQRQYATETAPLTRVAFRVGDTVTSHDGTSFVVTEVVEEEGLLTYNGDGHSLKEAHLADSTSFSKPQDRLFAAKLDPIASFERRYDALRTRCKILKSEVRGFAGGRIDLIPHQLFIAHEVSSRQAPRVLLADEVGLGKTIEACLILHRLHLLGKAQRILILVPDSLVHQWFVELFRKFNLWFSIYDEKRCKAIQESYPEDNPFWDDQLVLCSIDFLAHNETWHDHAVNADWDLLVVDEAHHLDWSPDDVSPEYEFVEALGKKTQGLLLLTATPQQLGKASHFARLRLLDPNRYSDYGSFQQEAENYERAALIINKIICAEPLTPEDYNTLENLSTVGTEDVIKDLKTLDSVVDDNLRSDIIRRLLDRHGTGRVMFRNTRTAISGFPERELKECSLEDYPNQGTAKGRWVSEFVAMIEKKELERQPNYREDPRIAWLTDFLKEHRGEKVLLICHFLKQVEAISAALQDRINVKIGVFHEELSLVQRDRNAAWFAEEDGADILVCSEIGSEGRNFQFAHHLVLLDIPANPELLEQRIGRLDRIGQKQTIQIHVPFLENSSLYFLKRWYHEGLNGFQKSLQDGQACYSAFGKQIEDFVRTSDQKKVDTANFENLVNETKQFHKQLCERLKKGQDRLLEMNSYQPHVAREIITKIMESDSDLSLDNFMLNTFDELGIHVDDLENRTYHVTPTNRLSEGIPGLPREGMTFTSERIRALSREDYGLLTWEHPIVMGCIEVILGNEKGNSSYTIIESDGPPEIILENIFCLECVADVNLQIERYLPPTPIRIVINQNQNNVTQDWDFDFLRGKLKKGNIHKILENELIAKELLPAMLKNAESQAEKMSKAFISEATIRAQDELGREIQRLLALKKINDHIREEEITMAKNQLTNLTKNIAEARLRLDAVRLITRGMF